jgi:hypothetical protein
VPNWTLDPQIVAAVLGAVVGAIAGAFCGAVGTLAWEGYFKPRSERKSLARVLATEIRDLANYLRQHREQGANLTQLAPAFHLTTALFDGLVSRLAELPAAQARRVASVYRQCKELNSAAERYVGMQLRYRAEPSTVLGDEMAVEVATFHRTMPVVEAHLLVTGDELALIADGERPPPFRAIPPGEANRIIAERYRPE